MTPGCTKGRDANGQKYTVAVNTLLLVNEDETIKQSIIIPLIIKKLLTRFIIVINLTEKRIHFKK